VSKAALHPTFYRPSWQLEKRLEHLKKLRDVYREKLMAIESEIAELKALLGGD